MHDLGLKSIPKLFVQAYNYHFISFNVTHDSPNSSAITASVLTMTEPKPWRKLLYLSQPYPDNYTNETFLSQLKRNTTVTPYPYGKLCFDFLLIDMHISNLLLTITLFIGYHKSNLDSLVPTLVSCAFAAIGYGYLLLTTSKKQGFTTGTGTGAGTGTRSILKSYILFIFILLLLSPVLKSLSKSTDDDSIWAVSFLLCLTNVLFHDYAMDPGSNYRPVVLTNLLLSNAIVLASRLDGSLHVFCFILTCIQTNILIPIFDFHLRKHHRFVLHYFLFGMVEFGWIFNMIRCFGWTDGSKLVLVIGAAQLGVAFVLPMYFLSLQRYKNELQGPWDPAKPILRSEMS